MSSAGLPALHRVTLVLGRTMALSGPQSSGCVRGRKPWRGGLQDGTAILNKPKESILIFVCASVQDVLKIVGAVSTSNPLQLRASSCSSCSMLALRLTSRRRRPMGAAPKSLHCSTFCLFDVILFQQHAYWFGKLRALTASCS